MWDEYVARGAQIESAPGEPKLLNTSEMLAAVVVGGAIVWAVVLVGGYHVAKLALAAFGAN